METAYAAVVSVVHLMEQIKLYHARQPIFLDEHQRQLQSLHNNIIYLQEFLENYSDGYRNEAEHLEKRIADAAFAIEDIIETHIVDDIQSKRKGSNRLSRGLRKMKDYVKKEALKIREKSRLKYPQYLTSQGENNTDHFLQGLQKVAQDMDFIKEEIAKIQENNTVEEHLAPAGSFRRSTTMKEVVVVFEDEVNQIMDKLTRNESNLQVLPITGMGGIGIFPEDTDIRVSKLIKLWVAEGFLKPPELESLEEVAENYLKDLVDRNLILVSRWGSTGNMKCFKIHDLLRDFCLREAQKKRFLCVDMVQNPNDSQDLNIQRRIVFHRQLSNNEYRVQVSRALQSASLARSLTCHYGLRPGSRARKLWNIRTRLNNKLLRILDMADDYLIRDAFQLVNARFVYVYLANCISCKIPSSICLMWNLQTLVIELCEVMIAPPEIWEMTQLRHLIISDVKLPNPLDSQNECVLENLQTLSGVEDLRWTDETLGKIPNIKKLKMEYFDASIWTTSTCLNNFVRLDKLQSLMCRFRQLFCYTSIMNIEFPLSIKKLTLWDNRFQWEDIATKVGSLPNLEKLKLMDCYAEGIEWNPVDGKFLRLKYLKIHRVRLRYWRADETHFPCLEALVFQLLRRLEEIPSGIGDIPSLQLIVLNSCSSSSIDSANKLLSEQQEMENESLRLVVDDSYAGYADLYDLFDQEEEEEEEKKRNS